MVIVHVARSRIVVLRMQNDIGDLKWGHVRMFIIKNKGTNKEFSTEMIVRIGIM